VQVPGVLPELPGTAGHPLLIRSWRHSGFDVFVGEPIAPDDRRALEHVARYLLRAPVSLERMRYDPTDVRVSMQPLPGEQGGTIELEALEFIARLILHIPDIHEQQVLYYGAYANASKLRRRLGARAESVLPLPCPYPADAGTLSPFEQRRRIRWARLIRRVWLEDPLLCPECGSEMHILSFITEPGVVDRILRHVGWRHGEPLPGVIRPPPPVLMVAEPSVYALIPAAPSERALSSTCGRIPNAEPTSGCRYGPERR
jgi:hypothetical protein